MTSSHSFIRNFEDLLWTRSWGLKKKKWGAGESWLHWPCVWVKGKKRKSLKDEKTGCKANRCVQGFNKEAVSRTQIWLQSQMSVWLHDTWFKSAQESTNLFFPHHNLCTHLTKSNSTSGTNLIAQSLVPIPNEKNPSQWLNFAFELPKPQAMNTWWVTAGARRRKTKRLGPFHV